MSKRKTPAAPTRTAEAIGDRTRRLELFYELTRDAHREQRAELEQARQRKLAHYAKRSLHLFVQFDSFGDEWYRCVTDECMRGASVARVLIPPGVPPEKLRAALEAFAKDYAADYEAIQDEIARNGTWLLGLSDADGDPLGFDDIPF